MRRSSRPLFGIRRPDYDLRCRELVTKRTEAISAHATAPQEAIHFDNSYVRLPERFHVRLNPTPVSDPKLIRLNAPLAEELGIDPGYLASPEGVAVLAGNAIAQGADPIAMAYAGHQFGSFVPQLGDGRAILLGEVVDRGGRRWDIQLKGSGPTPFSRRGDGRAALGPVLREYIVSEAMAALGIPTTRSLAAVATGEHVFRETPLPGAVLTRIAASHIRIGTFQFFAARSDNEAVRQLADYVVARHYPELSAVENRYAALLEAVVARQADLIVQWVLVGFIHGVMNTDNTSIAGETIDYGPCAFMDAYHPGTVFSSIDEMGRYAYGNQAAIGQWNLARLAETLLFLLADNEEKALGIAKDALAHFAERFNSGLAAGLGRKLGFRAQRDSDFALAQDLLERMAANGADFTLTFHGLNTAAADASKDEWLRTQFSNPTAFDEWAPRWHARLAEEGGDPAERAKIMRRANPVVIPRNHLVEEVVRAATDAGDLEPFGTLVGVLSDPYSDRPGLEHYMAAPRPEEIVRQTFCGT